MRRASSLLLISAALLAVPGRAAGESSLQSQCEVPMAAGGRLRLTLVGLDYSGWPRTCERLARYLRAGPPPFSAKLAQRSGTLLRGTRYFERGECSTASEGTILSCAVTPAKMIHEVRFEGRIPTAILRDDLRRRVFLRPGSLLEKEAETLARQEERLASYLEREGFFGSQVKVRTELTDGAEPNQGVVLVAAISAGKRARLGKITVEGRRPPEIRPSEIETFFRHSLLRLFRERFIPARVEEDVESFTKEMQNRGYPEAHVESRWALREGGEVADLILRIDPGPRVVVDYIGNRRVKDRRLRRRLTFSETGAADPVEVESSGRALQRAYQERGYHAVVVDARSDEQDEETLRITFEFQEGARAVVKELAFEGNTSFPRSVLLQDGGLTTRKASLLVRTRWVDEVVEADTRALKTFYKSKGFAAAEVEAVKEVRDDGGLRVLFRIREGPRRTVVSMTMEGVPEDVEERALRSRLDLRAGTPYVHSQLASDRRELLMALAEAGYPNAVVKRDLEKPEPEEGGPVTIHYRLLPGAKARYAGVLVSGNFRTRVRLIEERLSLEPGDNLNLLVIGRARRVLQELGPFSSVDVETVGLAAGGEDTWLGVAVKERAATTLDLVLAASTDDGVSIGADLRDRNLLGRAFHLDARLRAGWILGEIHPVARIGNADSVDLSTGAPAPFGAPFDVDATAFYRFQEKPEFTDRRIGIGAGLSRVLLERTRCGLCPDLRASLRYELSATEVEDPGGRLRDFDATNVGRVVPALSADRRDSFMDPRAGAFGEVRFEVAHAALSPLPDGATIWRLIASGQWYQSLGAPFEQPLSDGGILGGPIISAIGVSFGMAEPWGGADTVPESESFSYGGDASVRGLRLRASRSAWPDARYLLEATVELRWYVVQNVGLGSLQLAAFADLGAVSTVLDEVFAEPTVSVGPAIRYVTPVGPISLAWGKAVVVPTPLADVVSRRGRLHLTFGYTF